MDPAVVCDANPRANAWVALKFLFKLSLRFFFVEVLYSESVEYFSCCITTSII